MKFNVRPVTGLSRSTPLQEEVHLRVMRRLEEQPDINQRLLAHELGVSLGSVNYCLRALIDKGLVKIHNFSHSRHKLGYMYKLTPKGIAEKSAMATRFLHRKMAEYEALKQEIEELRAEVCSTPDACTEIDAASTVDR